MKLIGITMRRDNDNKWQEYRDSISEDWIKYSATNLKDYKFVPIPNIPDNVQKLASYMKLEGLVLSNGNDWGSCDERDKTEINLINWCREFKKPIIGICRGFQVLNKYFGGSLTKDLFKISEESHAGSIHKIKIIDKKILPRNTKNEFQVNSFHNQGITTSDLAKDLIAFAKSENIIEGFYHKTESIVGIQWHPERKSFEKSFDINLFRILFEKNIHSSFNS